MGPQIKEISAMNLDELLAIVKEQGDETPTAVIEAIKAKTVVVADSAIQRGSIILESLKERLGSDASESNHILGHLRVETEVRPVSTNQYRLLGPK